jgi:hypothetical protein
VVTAWQGLKVYTMPLTVSDRSEYVAPPEHTEVAALTRRAASLRRRTRAVRRGGNSTGETADPI